MSTSSAVIALTGRPLYTLTAMLLLAFAAVVAMPFNISGIVQSFGISNSTAGLIASVELGAISAASLLVARLAGSLSPRRIYAVGISAVLVANALTVLAADVSVLMVLRAIAGLGAGSVTATVMFTAGKSSDPERTFGIINSFVGIMGMAMALLLPQALLLHQVVSGGALQSVDGLYLTYVVAAVLALLLIRSVPVPPPANPTHVSADAGAGTPSASLSADSSAANTAAIRPAPLIGWVALWGLGIAFFGHGTLGIYIVELGLSTGLSAQAIGNTFAAGSLIGIGAPLLGGLIGARFRAALPITAILAAVAVFAVLLAHTDSPLGFYVLAPLFSVGPMMMIPLALGVLARIDRSGRLTGSHPAFVTLGGAIAPIAGGALRDMSGGFALTGWFVAGCLLVGLMLMAAAIRRADRSRVSTTPGL
ncbi:MAG: MFS transporter [Gammaproteobacteria bacterium]